MPTWSLQQISQTNFEVSWFASSVFAIEIMKDCRKSSILDATRCFNVGCMIYHLRISTKKYYHLRVFFKIFHLTLFHPDWNSLSGSKGSTPHPRGVLIHFSVWRRAAEQGIIFRIPTPGQGIIFVKIGSMTGSIFVIFYPERLFWDICTLRM